eukprot:gene10453-biopygen130
MWGIFAPLPFLLQLCDAGVETRPQLRRTGYGRRDIRVGRRRIVMEGRRVRTEARLQSLSRTLGRSVNQLLSAGGGDQLPPNNL